MEDKDYLDNQIKSAIYDNVFNIKASKDIFNEAWNEKEKEMRKRRYFNFENIRKAALVSACCAAFVIVGVFTCVPGARVAAQEVLKSIFVLDKSGNIVEKSEDEIMDKYNIGGIFITDNNKNEMEQKLGFSIYLPEKIGDYSIEKLDEKNAFTAVHITAKGVKYKDDNENLQDRFMKAIEDDEAFKELNKDYDMERFVSSSYLDDKNNRICIYLSKYTGDSKMDLVKEVNIDNMECRVLQKTNAEYDTKKDDKFMSTDMTKKPNSVDKVYYMEWNYEGIDYSIYIGKNSSDIDSATQFAEAYIKSLKEK